MLINLSWFLAGALIYKFSLYLFGLGKSINLFAQTLVSCLLMIKKIDEQVLLIFEKEADLLKKERVVEEQINSIKDSKMQAHKLWRELLVGTIISCCPNKIRSTLRFNDWNSAMKILKK